MNVFLYGSDPFVNLIIIIIISLIRKCFTYFSTDLPTLPVVAVILIGGNDRVVLTVKKCERIKPGIVMHQSI